MTRTDARSGPALRVGLCSRTGGYFWAMSNTTLIIVIVVAIVVVAAIAVFGYRWPSRSGPRVCVSNTDLSTTAPSTKPIANARRSRSCETAPSGTSKLELRSLDSSEREDFERRWSEVQGQFVDDPSNAVRNADLLVVEVMAARGYPVENFDQRADDLSVSHPEVTQRYREARRIAQANKDGNADTEDLRQAVTSYRSLVLALLADDGDRSRAQRHRQRSRKQPDDGTGDQSMSTDATTTGGMSGTPQKRGDAGSAAERLGGPIEDEQSLGHRQKGETSDDRPPTDSRWRARAGPDTTRRAETMMIVKPITAPVNARH